MKIIECEQNSAEWFAVKAGVPSASNFSKIVNMDGKPSKQRTKYLYRLAGERISGISGELYQSAAMKRGQEMEAEARSLYEIITGEDVRQVGFILNEKPICGCSPDVLVGDNGLVEIKCPMIETHVGYLLENKLPSDYFQQVHGQMLISQRMWCDFMSYYPGIKPFIIRIEQDVKFLTLLYAELKLFCEELETVVKQIQ